MMATLQHEQFTKRHPPRPQFQNQHSNSVPSTPYQQPRDLRFPSRSPSPHRGLGNQSPRSVASEAVQGQNGVPRGVLSTPAVCKFETAPEYRKRRMPYVDGGEKELGPPKKDLKKTLNPAEEGKLSDDMRELYDRLLPSEESEKRRAALVSKLDRVMKEEWPGSDIKVAVFGSSGNLLSSSDSDVDICVTTTDKNLESMHSLAWLLSRNGMEKVVCRAAAKVPIVKFWDPVDQLACDINVNNPLALENTRMIKTYVQLDERVRPLAKIIKHWTKQRILNDAAFGGTISSYTWICMIISFLQRRDPPILPSLQKMKGAKRSEVDGKESAFADDIESLKGFGDANKETQAQLLFQFFRHYGYEFQYSANVVSVKEGRLLSRKEKGWDNYADNKEARCRLCVEEPFNTPRNLGNSADDYSFSGIHAEIRRAFELLADGCQLDKCCEQFEFPPEPEKVLFQRPPPKPKPTLTRSASQSGGRANHEPGSGRRNGKTRNQSAQRAGNRRASSGAAFSAQRGTFLQSPPIGVNALDYFAKGNLHEQLYQQYQYLQAQQDALRNQLVAQQANQQAHAQIQARTGDLAGLSSPHQRPQFPPGSLANGRFVNDAPQTAPLMQNYVYHYPPRYPPPSPMQPQHGQRSREGTSTNPSSPSLVAAVPALRRQAQRTSVTEGSNGSIRSQSQPGRSFPYNMSLQQYVAQQGYDLAALQNGQQNGRIPQLYGHGHSTIPFPPVPNMHPTVSSSGIDTAMPKEYIGYYVGQSPQLTPQYTNASGAQVPSMPALRDPPQRQRRVTPDLMPPIPNGRHVSRSPSPLNHLRSYSTAGDLRAARAQSVTAQSPASYEPPAPITMPDVDLGGPLIVNGSNPPVLPKPVERLNGTLKGSISSPPVQPDAQRGYSLPLRTLDTNVSEPEASLDRPPSPRVSPSPRTKNAPRLSLSPNGKARPVNGVGEPYAEIPPLTAAPLLSPVAELRTPSPTHARVFDGGHESPQRHQVNGIAKPLPLANGTTPQHNTFENTKPVMKPHERKLSTSEKPKPQVKSSVTSNGGLSAASNLEKNPWQPAPSRKGHKKSKSTAVAAGGRGAGEQMPVNESERKGG